MAINANTLILKRDLAYKENEKDLSRHGSALSRLLIQLTFSYLSRSGKVAQSERCPVHRKVAGSIPNLGTYPGCGFVPS